MRFKVWDALNELEDDSNTQYCKDSAEEAALAYAEGDTDGLCDGLYHDGPQPIMVRCCKTGVLTKFDVGCEYDPVFSATKAKDQQ